MKIFIATILFLSISYVPQVSAESDFRASQSYMRSIGGEYYPKSYNKYGVTPFVTSNGGIGVTGDICSGWTLFKEFEALVANWSVLVDYLKNAAIMAAKAEVEKMICTKSPLLCSILRGNKLLGMLNFYGENKRCSDLLNLSENAYQKKMKDDIRKCMEKLDPTTQADAIDKCHDEGGFQMFGDWSSKIKGNDVYDDYIGKKIPDNEYAQNFGNFFKNTIGGLTVETATSFTSTITENTRREVARLAYAEYIAQKKQTDKQVDAIVNDTPDPEQARSQLANYLVIKSGNVLRSMAEDSFGPKKTDQQKDDEMKPIELISPQFTPRQADELVKNLEPEEIKIILYKMNERQARLKVLSKLYLARDMLYEKLSDVTEFTDTNSPEYVKMSYDLQRTIANIQDLKHTIEQEDNYREWLNKVVEGSDFRVNRISNEIKQEARNQGVESNKGIE